MLKGIKEGWSAYIASYKGKVSDHKQKLAEARAKICQGCDQLVESRLFSVVKRLLNIRGEKKEQTQKIEVTDRKDATEAEYKCNKCGCGWPAMLYAEGKKCPLGKW